MSNSWPTFSLKLDGTTSGVPLRQAIDDAIRIARLLNVTVHFTFNGKEVPVWPDSDPDYEYRSWLKWHGNAS